MIVLYTAKEQNLSNRETFLCLMLDIQELSPFWKHFTCIYKYFEIPYTDIFIEGTIHFYLHYQQKFIEYFLQKDFHDHVN